MYTLDFSSRPEKSDNGDFTALSPIPSVLVRASGRTAQYNDYRVDWRRGEYLSPPKPSPRMGFPAYYLQPGLANSILCVHVNVNNTSESMQALLMLKLFTFNCLSIAPPLLVAHLHHTHDRDLSFAGLNDLHHTHDRDLSFAGLNDLHHTHDRDLPLAGQVCGGT